MTTPALAPTPASVAAWERSILSKYGITAAQYYEILEAQGGGCAVCGKTPAANKQRLAVDHNHKKDNCVIRGLLCKFDNSIVVAQHLDNPKRAAGLASYILDPPGPRVLGPDHRVPAATANKPRNNRLTNKYQAGLLARDTPTPTRIPKVAARPGRREI